MELSVFPLRNSLRKFPCDCLPYYVLVNDTWRIVGSSIVKIDRVSDRYCFYYNFSDIEQQMLHLLLLYQINVFVKTYFSCTIDLVD